MNGLLENLLFSLGGLLVAVIAYFVREYITSSKAKTDAQEHEIRGILTQIQALHLTIADVSMQMREALSKLDRHWVEIHLKTDSKIDLLSQLVNQYNKDAAKLEGRLEEHMMLLSSQISTNRNLSDKLHRIFEYIDAKERASDSAIKETDPSADV